MPFERRAVVHVVDDDASQRGALESLSDSVALATRTYGAAGEFLSRPHAKSGSNRRGQHP
jgi:FixJ family two-component response regulator